MFELWLTGPVFIAAWAGTELMRRYGAKRLLDLPNERSSHSRPVPRGGGVAIVVAFLGGTITLWWRGLMPDDLLLALLVGGGLIMSVGFWDDHVNLPAQIRLPLHLSAAALAVALLGPIQRIPFGEQTWLVPTWLAWPLTVVALTWLVNLYNFMDGIDGIAAVEAISVSCAATLVGSVIATYIPGLIVLAAAALGFLMLNWPPARIFMGDAGSGFLGYAFGVYLLFATDADARFVWVWLILLAVFWVDATVTLVRRALAGERLLAAHRSHAYQLAALRWRSHLRVTLAVLALNVLVLLPLAALAVVRPNAAWFYATAAAIGITVLVLALGAGHRSTL
ncbi:MAG: glycosyltransferase family 4 protein [Sutterellaceae bacterium]|nr:glycosyltransferase family 4 protein [Burkholderiaceae bacterium]MDW8429544.1 glycosyltransferase family 4 protein [Sutterellaceae bacterium]